MQSQQEVFGQVVSQIAAAHLSDERLLEMMASGCALPDFLNALCRFVEDECRQCRCGVDLIDYCGTRLRTLAAPSLPAIFNEAICRLSADREATLPQTVTCMQIPVVASDAEWDRLWQVSTFQSIAMAQGFRSCRSTPIYSRAGRVRGTIAIFQSASAIPISLKPDLLAKVTHITSIAIERAEVESALRRSEAFLLEAQRLSSTGSFSWRLATDEITWSDEMYHIFEFERHAPVSIERFLSRVHPEDLPLVCQMIAQTRRDGSDYAYEYRLLMPDFSVKHLRVVARGARDGWGNIEFIGAIQDVTDCRRSQLALDKARSELAHVSRLTSLGTLTASIAHELNQPLTGVITNASTCVRMLGANPPDVAGALKTAFRTIRDGNRAAEVITRLRALFAKKVTSIEPMDLNEAALEVTALSQSELQRNRVTLQLELTDDIPAIVGDRIQLQQVILNLILNASEAMSGIDDRPRNLFIRTVREGDCVRLSVEDAGVGLPFDEADKVFEAFYTTKPDGMGIGLSVSRSIIERHGGRLWAQCNEGPGATFTFSIPRCNPP